jgi:hypothetical protein
MAEIFACEAERELASFAMPGVGRTVTYFTLYNATGLPANRYI